jgi:hypothetical protein
MLRLNKEVEVTRTDGLDFICKKCERTSQSILYIPGKDYYQTKCPHCGDITYTRNRKQYKDG